MSNLPQRYLVYYGGSATDLVLRLVTEFAVQSKPSVEQVIFVVGDRQHYREVVNHSKDHRFRFLCQQDGLQDFLARADIHNCSIGAMEEKYGSPNLWRFVMAERQYDGLPYEEKVRYLLAHLEYFEDLFRKYQPEVFITGSPDCLPFLVALAVFKKNGSLPLVLAPGRMPGRFFVLDNDVEQIPFLENVYSGVKARGLAEEEKGAVGEIRKRYSVDRVRPSYFSKDLGMRIVPSLPRALSLLRRRVGQEYEGPEPSWLSSVFHSLGWRLRTPFQKLDLDRLTSPRIPDSKFFYFPLHYEPESSLDVLGTFYRDQYAVIRRVVEALPAGYELCIKEHPNMWPGLRPLGYYRRLVELGSVRLLPAGINSYDIIAKSCGVVTIAGTSGFEALFLGKPVLLFGRTFYEVFREGVFRPRGMDLLADTLRQMAHFKGFESDQLDKFVAALLRRSYRGDFEQTAADCESPQNAKALAQGLSAELECRLDGWLA